MLLVSSANPVIWHVQIMAFLEMRLRMQQHKVSQIKLGCHSLVIPLEPSKIPIGNQISKETISLRAVSQQGQPSRFGPQVQL
jgi:hypothetical protein